MSRGTFHCPSGGNETEKSFPSSSENNPFQQKGVIQDGMARCGGIDAFHLQLLDNYSFTFNPEVHLVA